MKIIMKSLSQLLQSLSLSERESSLYLVCLQYWETTASTLARMTWIPRASIYDTTARLVKRWFIRVVKRDGKSKYSAVDPRDVYIQLNEKKNIIQEQVKEFRESLQDFDELRQFKWMVPQVQYYEGKESLEQFFQKIAWAEYSYSIFSVDDLLKHVYFDIEKLYKWLSNPDIKWAKRIVSHSEIAKKYLSMQKNDRIERKMLPPWYTMEAEISLYDWVLLQMSFGDQPAILETHHPVYYKAQKTLFNYMWESLS